MTKPGCHSNSKFGIIVSVTTTLYAALANRYTTKCLKKHPPPGRRGRREFSSCMTKSYRDSYTFQNPVSAHSNGNARILGSEKYMNPCRILSYNLKTRAGSRGKRLGLTAAQAHTRFPSFSKNAEKCLTKHPPGRPGGSVLGSHLGPRPPELQKNA